MSRFPISPTELSSLIGAETGVSDWITVDQSRINAFAACTEDFQFIHIDPVQAKEKAGLVSIHMIVFFFLSLNFKEGLDYIQTFVFESSLKN